MIPHASASVAETRRWTRHITLLSVGVAVFLLAIKAFAWGASGSVSILASLADSGLDLVASLVTFFAVRWAAAPPDADHRYGRGKAEALAALVQSGLVFASAAFIGWEAIRRIFDPQPILAGGWAVGVMIVSLVVTVGLVVLQTGVLRKTGSLAVAGDRAHYAADIGANLVVLIGVASGAWLAAPGLDAAAGLVVAVWLFWGAVGMMKQSADHLLDKGVDESVRARVVELVLKDPRLTGVHQLRTRMTGSVMLVQMHVDLDPGLTLEAAHAIVVEAENRILEAFPASDILIHPDPRGRAEPHGGAFAEGQGPDEGATSVPATPAG